MSKLNEVPTVKVITVNPVDGAITNTSESEPLHT